MRLAALVLIATTAAAQAEPFQPAPDDMALIEAGVAGQLLDPGSAILSEVIAGPAEGGELTYVCGNVRGKNTFGGYAQPTPFMGAIIQETTGRRSFMLMRIAEPDPAIQADLATLCLESLKPAS